MPGGTTIGFESAWESVRAVPGWLTEGQARMLWDAVCRLPAGATVVEIGSHQGRSTIVLGHAARTIGARVVAVDAFVDGRLFGGASTRARFEANIAAAGLTDVVELVVGFSTRLRPTWTRPFDLLYVDGKHDYWTYVDDLRWSAHLPSGGEILVHDCFSSIGVTSGTVAKVLCGSRYSYVDRSRSLARFTVRRPGLADRWRVVAQLPWFAGNVALKVLLRLRLRPVARLFGHRGSYDPF
ncbi:class I SAM-dependent methyltransferase [Actinophytocola oryzae]|uniref:Methyltransferase family protein n=1 Tax=Actinophytocola oryzae TaxID=502181 RepID=A0A4R7UZX4_9PSEU|nr:class I SAM-dependent methyltransferase [Actinophytocola oryzae]TDV41757.1 methyltransferase family protein [Actinophytocola oryzae]